DTRLTESKQVKPGQSVKLACEVSGFSMSSYYMSWIRQTEGKRLEWIGHIDGGTGTAYSQKRLQNQFVISKNSNTLYLEGKNFQQQDTATYYCARHAQCGLLVVTHLDQWILEETKCLMLASTCLLSIQVAYE
uniref:Ig-like domain-containing protein n=1 Tax=Erpetoichthys calabaricus TaxID=27687 RepID=A0A8C4RGK4_ERPCA